MIKGDIDLTENLDFYRDKSNKELPSIIPWKKSDTINKINYTSFDFDQFFTSTNYTTTSSSTIRITIDNVTYNTDISYNITNNWYNSTDISYNSISNYTNKLCEICYSQFNNKKSSLPWDSKSRNKDIASIKFNKKEKYYKKIPWILKSIYRIFSLNTINIPWDKKHIKFNKEERICPWFKYLHSRIYEDYINDLSKEQNYDSYLTNMTWLGIH